MNDLSFHFKQAGTKWIGECIQLNIGAYGDTLMEAREATFDLVILHLKAQRDLFDRQLMEDMS